MTECTKCDSRNVKHFHAYEFFDFYECLNCKSIFSFGIDECCRNPSTIFVIEHYSNNTLTRIFKQCSTCGGAFKKDKFPNKTHGNLVESEFSETTFNNWNKRRNDENLIISELFEAHRKSRFYNYHKYLQSEEWKTIRNQVIERDNGLCLHCKINPAQEVHHKHYNNIYREKIDDLESVCSNCHREIHKSILNEISRQVRFTIRLTPTSKNISLNSLTNQKCDSYNLYR